jgi:hypothetical protein
MKRNQNTPATRKSIPMKVDNLAALWLASISCSVLVAAASAQTSEAKSALSPGPIKRKTIYVDKGRGYPFAEFEVVIRRPPNLAVQIYNTSGVTDFTDSVNDKFNAMDAGALAKQLGADGVVKNPRRYWMMDRLWSYGAGQT